VDAVTAKLSDFRQKIMEILKPTVTGEDTANAFYTSLLHGVTGPAKQVRTRSVTIPQGGLGGAKSVKLRNLMVHTGKVAEFFAHSAIFAVHGSAHPSPLLTALGVVLLANCVREGMTVHIPEQDATVFWGLIEAQKNPGNNKSAPESDILALTNQERGKVHLGILPPEAITRSLHHLAAIKCVKKVAGNPVRWCIVEKVKIA
jgi:hypothetical protein